MGRNAAGSAEHDLAERKDQGFWQVSSSAFGHCLLVLLCSVGHSDFVAVVVVVHARITMMVDRLAARHVHHMQSNNHP